MRFALWQTTRIDMELFISEDCVDSTVITLNAVQGFLSWVTRWRSGLSEVCICFCLRFHFSVFILLRFFLIVLFHLYNKNTLVQWKYTKCIWYFIFYSIVFHVDYSNNTHFEIVDIHKLSWVWRSVAACPLLRRQGAAAPRAAYGTGRAEETA